MVGLTLKKVSSCSQKPRAPKTKTIPAERIGMIGSVRSLIHDTVRAMAVAAMQKALATKIG